MAKIRKNLSDEDMLKGFSEELSFENGIYSEEKTTARMKLKAKAPAPAKKELLLPQDAQERLNRFLLEISMEWLKNKNGDCTWKVLKEGGQIVIKPVAKSK
ncbi:MAG: hypothetical protein IKY40_04650 [Phascolarctobacterium sp.]|jgi:hypothetical protein|nr:hypothetical protein [Phascolarctobacterium sp.]MBQ6617892.1 hypothetical protein [Phascolarctobacterium sp.]MBQ9764064.1 hypothetical protein [Phascolarctobacterium sp.]MBR4958492.1 hypothetical protein [Phascolarctobacterium sp.]MBR5173128.1 hypothetical protein [Phascolarctobacterium sp.]